MKQNYKIYVGTSGWMYKDWGKRFYPADLKEDQLTYLSHEFPTVEINSSFYRMPRVSAFEGWRKKVGKDFVFAIKLNQYITHRKRLIIDEKSSSYLEAFLINAQGLKEKLAVILIQLPPSFKKDIHRLGQFLTTYTQFVAKLEYKPTSAIEFRHESWFEEDVYELLREHNIGFVISSTPEYRRLVFTADFAYIRMHGGEVRDSRYLKKDLDKLHKEIENFPTNIKKVFVYFNNDYSAYAIDNARYLKQLFERHSR